MIRLPWTERNERRRNFQKNILLELLSLHKPSEKPSSKVSSHLRSVDSHSQTKNYSQLDEIFKKEALPNDSTTSNRKSSSVQSKEKLMNQKIPRIKLNSKIFRSVDQTTLDSDRFDLNIGQVPYEDCSIFDSKVISSRSPRDNNSKIKSVPQNSLILKSLRSTSLEPERELSLDNSQIAYRQFRYKDPLPKSSRAKGLMIPKLLQKNIKLPHLEKQYALAAKKERFRLKFEKENPPTMNEAIENCKSFKEYGERVHEMKSQIDKQYERELFFQAQSNLIHHQREIEMANKDWKKAQVSGLLPFPRKKQLTLKELMLPEGGPDFMEVAGLPTI